MNLLCLFARQHRSPDDPRVIPFLAGDDFDSLARAGHRAILGGFDDDGHHIVSQGVYHSPAEHDDLRIENIDEIGHRDAGVFGGFLDDFFHELVAFADCLAKIAAAQILEIGAERLGEQRLLAVGHGGADFSEDGGAAGQRLEAAAVAAIALGAAHLDDHVTDLPGRPVEAGKQFTVNNNSSADAGAQKNPHDVARLGLQFRLVDSEHAAASYTHLRAHET